MPESGGRIIDKCRPGTFEGYMLDTYPGNSLRLHTPNGGCSYDAKLAGDRWTHVAGVYSSSKRFARLYIDGREVAFAAGGGAYPPLTKTPQPLRIGVDPAGGNRFIGRIQRAAVHRRALSADEVARRAAGAAPSEGVVADWTFASASAEVVQPSAGRVPLRRLGSPGGRLLTPQGVPFQWPPGEHNIAFTSQWDNWPRIITVPVNKQAEAAWFLICGSTNSMQTRIANARLVLAYADGVEDVLELVPPENFWTLCHIGGTDYDYKRDAFCLPKTPPPAVQLGNNCRAMLLNRRLRAGVILKSVTLETLSQEVVVGLMGLTLER
jgi:hypothetical protein